MRHFKTLPRNIFIAMLFGVAVGLFLPASSGYFSFLGQIFRNALAMVVMPIVITSILSGMETVGDFGHLSRLGKRTLFYFLSTTFIAVIVGLLLVSTIEPGISRPSPRMQEAISSVQGASVEETARLISARVVTVLQLRPDAVQIKDLDHSLQELVRNGASSATLKDSALRLLGSLELRSQLSPSERPKPIDSVSWLQFLGRQIDTLLVNPFEAMAGRNFLAVIVFTLLIGGAMASMGARAEPFFALSRIVNEAVIKIVGLIMRFAPLGVFGLIVDVVATTGGSVFSKLGYYAVCVVLGLSIHLFLLLPLIAYLFAKTDPLWLFKGMRPALAVAFSTSSSSATLPLSLQCVEENLKVKPVVSRFVLPLGATVNMDGTALYEAVAAVFIAQLYGVSLGIKSQIIVAITASLASIGAAGIPAAGTVTMAMVLSAVGLPLEGIGILLAIDRPLDMCRTAVNVMGDAVGAVVINRFERSV